MELREIAISLLATWHTRLVTTDEGERLSVIASYHTQLDRIALHHNLELLEVFKSDNTVQGLFKLKG